MTKITIDRAVVEQALEALRHGVKRLNHRGGTVECLPLHDVITALKAALAEPVQAKFDDVAVEQWKLRMVFYDENGEPLMSRQPEPDEIRAALAEPQEPENPRRKGLAQSLRGIADGFEQKTYWFRPDPLVMSTLRRAADELDKEEV